MVHLIFLASASAIGNFIGSAFPKPKLLSGSCQNNLFSFDLCVRRVAKPGIRVTNLVNIKGPENGSRGVRWEGNIACVRKIICSLQRKRDRISFLNSHLDRNYFLNKIFRNNWMEVVH